MPLLRAWDRLALVAVPTAVSCARAFATQTLRWWGVPRVTDDALLVVSELVTNAVRAAGPRTPEPEWVQVTAEHVIGVQLRVNPARLYVEVWDGAGDFLAAARAPGPDDEGGRGLLLVQSVACDWGIVRPPVGGKIVWAELALFGAPQLTTRRPALPHRVPTNVRVPPGKAREQVETALMERLLGGLRAWE
ncbi:ATP-binding protein [Streptomyces sp. NBC_01498]|uniref:ATP-binding protein n=1 Tax=Streptomyces sp. NBC_01498 TaxID=2975870 RepID=UPI002E7B3F64|nr:ATP-binding protein [Streptomyces sp. NBC_01498]WTL26889.1 ATP-binding protein [Streptomyces sp. NBC_01498]